MPEHINSLQWRKKKICDLQKVCVRQCCGAGGAEIIGGPGAGAENKFKYTFSAVSWEDARTKKS